MEAVGLALLGLIAATAASVWGAGQLAGRLASGAWLPVTAGDMPEVAMRLPQHLGDPAAAWPAAASSLLPGPVGFWSSFAAVLAAPLLVGIAVVHRRSGAQGETIGGRARWAGKRDLSRLRVRHASPGRLTLGRHGRRLLAAESRHSLVVLGPTQSGKTSGLAIPAILEWEGPVVATSVKTDLLDDTIAWRRGQGNVWVYDPTGTAGPAVSASTWTPLAACSTWQGALRTGTWIAQAGREDASVEDADFWYANAAKLLAPLLFAAAQSGGTMTEVVRWVDTQEEHEVRLELEVAGVREALHAAEASWKREERQRSSVYTTAETVLRAFADPAVAASASSCDIDVEGLLARGSGSLYICAPSHEQARLRPLFSTLVHQIVTSAYGRANRNGPLDPPLLLVLDEAANIAPLRDLDTIASTAAGIGIQLVTVFQDLAQISARYGGRAPSIVNNHRAKLALSGISDEPTLSYFGRLAGEAEVTRASVSRDADGRVSTTDATQMRALAPADSLRQLRPGEAMLVYGHLPPAKLTLRPWFRTRELRRRAELPKERI